MPLTNYSFQQLIDFTRTSAGTFVGSNGLIQNTPQSRNLLTWTQEFDNGAWSKSASTVTANSTAAPDGTMTADKLIDTTANAMHYVTRSLALSSGAHVFSVYIKQAELSAANMWFNNTASEGVAYFNLAAGTVSVTVGTIVDTAAITNVGNGWYLCSITTKSLSAGTFFPAIGTGNPATYIGTGSGVFLWGAQLEQASTASDYTRNVGGLFPPRFDYDPVTLAPRGILIDEQRTNLSLYSEDFTNAYRVPQDVTIAANSTTSPSGVVNADTIIPNTTLTSVHRTFVNPGIGAGAHSLSLYAKTSGYSWLKLRLGSLYANFNVSTGVAGVTAAGVTSTITNVGNGWYRCTMTGTALAGDSVFIYPMTTDNAAADPVAYAGNNVSGIFIWGEQLEAGAFATSYIPTVASQVTRTADQASIVAPMFAPWYNTSAGTFVFEGTVLAASGFAWPLSASAGSAANAISMYRSGAFVAGFIASSGTTQLEITSSPVVANVPYKMAVSAQANDGNFSFNGNIGTNDTTITMPTVNRLSLGANAAGTSDFLNGHIRRVTYYPTRLTNAQLQALTA